MKKLNVEQIKKLKCPDGQKQSKVHDGNGLYLLIKDSGSKLWRFRYVFGGKNKEMALGKFPNVTLAEARKETYAARLNLLNGNDPMKIRKDLKQAEVTLQQKNIITFDEAAHQWFEANSADWSDGYKNKKLKYIEKDCASILHKPITEVEKNDLIAIVDKTINAGNRKKVPPLFRTIIKIFDLAEAKEEVEVNVARLVKYV